MASEELHQDHTAPLGEAEHERNQEDGNELNSAGDELTSATAFRPDLFEAAINCHTDGDYRRLTAQLVGPSPDAFSADLIEWVDIYGTLLHAILYSRGEVPLDFVRSIVDLGSKDLISQRDMDGYTPLHVAAACQPERSDIAEFLTEQVPDVVNERSDSNSRPIDILSHKVIMLDEAEKYGRAADTKGIWRTVHILAKTTRLDIDFWQPLIHSCVASPQFPVALLMRAMKRFPEQLNQRNEHGDLPLHLMVKKRQLDIDDDDSDEESVEVRLFSDMLGKNLGAAEALNNNGMSPLALAIQNGYGRHLPIIRDMLLQAPASVVTIELPLKVLPFLYQRLLEKDLLSAVFVLLKANPPT